MDSREEYFSVSIGNSSVSMSSDVGSPSASTETGEGKLTLNLCYYEANGKSESKSPLYND